MISEEALARLRDLIVRTDVFEALGTLYRLHDHRLYRFQAIYEAEPTACMIDLRQGTGSTTSQGLEVSAKDIAGSRLEYGSEIVCPDPEIRIKCFRLVEAHDPGEKGWQKIQERGHQRALEALARSLGEEDADGIEILAKLRRIEATAHKQALQECNVGLPEVEMEAGDAAVERRVKKLFNDQLPPGFFINGDPRGYALKLKEKLPAFPLHTDFGGYPILAPEER